MQETAALSRAFSARSRAFSAWIVLLVFIVWLGLLLSLSGLGSYGGIAPDYFLGAVIFFHLVGRLREKHVGVILSVALLSAAASAGGAVPAGARLLGYALSLLLLPPGEGLPGRPLFLAIGIAAREAIVVIVCAVVLYLAGTGFGRLFIGEGIISIVLTVPGAMGVFYLLVGLGGLLGLRASKRHLSRPDTLTDAFAYERVLDRADIRLET